MHKTILTRVRKSEYRNTLFLRPDAQRQPTGAELIGTCQRPDGSRLRAMARGYRKHRSSFWLTADQSQPHTACLTESTIDSNSH